MDLPRYKKHEQQLPMTPQLHDVYVMSARTSSYFVPKRSRSSGIIQTFQGVLAFGPFSTRNHEDDSYQVCNVIIEELMKRLILSV